MTHYKTEKSILLIDDHALFRAGLRLILQSKIIAKTIEVEKISDVNDIDEDVDVILLDICLPGLNGIDGMSILHHRWPLARIMLLSALSHHEDINNALTLGASCYLNKNTDPAVICKTVQSLLDNRFSNENSLIEAASAKVITQAQTMLSLRLLEVLALMAEGDSNKEIADKLTLSENTIRNHIANLMDHFLVNNRTKIIIAAQQAGYLDKKD